MLEKFELAFGQIMSKVKGNIQVISVQSIPSTLSEYLSPYVVPYMIFGCLE